MTPSPDLSRLLPQAPPLPRRILVEEHRHPEDCSCDCFRRGFAAGQRAEATRAEEEMIGCRLLVPMLAALVLALAAVVAWLRWVS